MNKNNKETQTVKAKSKPGILKKFARKIPYSIYYILFFVYAMLFVICFGGRAILEKIAFTEVQGAYQTIDNFFPQFFAISEMIWLRVVLIIFSVITLYLYLIKTRIIK